MPPNSLSSWTRCSSCSAPTSDRIVDVVSWRLSATFSIRLSCLVVCQASQMATAARTREALPTYRPRSPHTAPVYRLTCDHVAAQISWSVVRRACRSDTSHTRLGRRRHGRGPAEESPPRSTPHPCDAGSTRRSCRKRRLGDATVSITLDVYSPQSRQCKRTPHPEWLRPTRESIPWPNWLRPSLSLRESAY